MIEKYWKMRQELKLPQVTDKRFQVRLVDSEVEMREALAIVHDAYVAKRLYETIDVPTPSNLGSYFGARAKAYEIYSIEPENLGDRIKNSPSFLRNRNNLSRRLNINLGLKIFSKDKRNTENVIIENISKDGICLRFKTLPANNETFSHPSREFPRE